MIITESRLRSTIHKILLAEAVKNRHGISENKLRQIIREALLRESVHDDIDAFLSWIDNALTALDIAAAVGSATGVLAPVAIPAQQILSKTAAVVDLIQALSALAADPPDYEEFWVNGLSAVISLAVDHAIARAITAGVAPALITAWHRRALIVSLAQAATEWWASRDKISPADAEKIKKEIQKNPEPDVGESDNTEPEPDVGESENIDDGESDGSDDPVLPAPPSRPRPAQPSSPSSDCPVSKRFAFKYNSWGGSIQDMLDEPPITVTADLKVGKLLGNTGWTIKNVQTDDEGQPTLVKIIHTSGKCLRVLPLDSPN